MITMLLPRMLLAVALVVAMMLHATFTQVFELNVRQFWILCGCNIAAIISAGMWVYLVYGK